MAGLGAITLALGSGIGPLPKRLVFVDSWRSPSQVRLGSRAARSLPKLGCGEWRWAGVLSAGRFGDPTPLRPRGQRDDRGGLLVPGKNRRRRHHGADGGNAERKRKRLARRERADWTRAAGPARARGAAAIDRSDSNRARRSWSRTRTEDHRCGIGRRRSARCDPESSQGKAAAKDTTATSLVHSRRADLQTAQARFGEKRSAA
jgi:hypothetical protein